MTYNEVINHLKEGNERYVAGTPRHSVVSAELRIELYKKGQHPYAVVIGCSDSRVPSELIFDAGPGEIFVIRTAGNVVGTIELGSLEYGVMHLKAPLIVVLGHQHCGAVKAAIDGGNHSPAIQELLGEIIPSIPTTPSHNPYEICEDENIRRTLAKIAADPFVSKAVSDGIVHLVAAKYSLETGKVSFFE